jgi:multiple sugar transport system substrate-binding protein
MLEPDQVLRASNHVGTAPGRLSALAQSEIWNEEGDLRYLSQQLLNGIAFPRPITPAYPSITVAFFTAMDNIINGADVQDELDKAVDTIDRVIAENDGFPNLE